MKDVVVSVKVDDKPKGMDGPGILLVSTEKERAAEAYTDLGHIENEWGRGSKVYGKASALFCQGGAQPSPPKLVREVTVLGVGDVGTPDELAEKIREYGSRDDSWYIFLTDRTEDEYIRKLSEFAAASEPTEAGLMSGEEDNRKVYFAETSNKELEGVSGRSVIVYTPELERHLDAAYLGAVMPWYPRHVTWKFKLPQGTDAPELTDQERDLLEKRHINYVSDEYKNRYMKNGVCADGEWIDSLLGADWVARDMRNELYAVFRQNEIVPYTDEGFALIGMAVFRTMDRAVKHGIIASDRESGAGVYKVGIPARSTATEEQARAREMPDITWEAQLEGAVHRAVTKGVLKVSL